MKYLTLLFTIAVGAAGCAQTTVNKNTEPANDSAPVITEKVKQVETDVAECKICEFDFANYKGELKKEEVEGLLLALNDEYLATAIYQGVNEKFDDPRPFVSIVEAEIRHSESLKVLFETYKMPIPENTWIGNAPAFGSVKEACEAGIKAEVANRDLYDRLFKSSARDDILFVYKNLQRASEENHKPAFERCASGNGGGKGRGRGAGRDQ